MSNKRTQEIRNKIKTLTALTKYIKLQWVPAHCGLQGNELADQLAKRGTKIQQFRQYEIPYQSAKLIINRRIKEEVMEQNRNASNNKPWAILNNKDTVPGKEQWLFFAQ